MQWTSCVPLSFKRNFVQGLLHRSWMICSTLALFNSELSIIRDILLCNGYPTAFINSAIRKFQLRSSTPQPTDIPIGPSKKPIHITLPYLGHRSERIRRTLQRMTTAAMPWATVFLHFYSSSKLTCLTKLKDRLPNLCRSRVVYKIECPSCDQFYIGKTIRRLSQRMKEHRHNINGPIRQHQDATGHVIDTERPGIICSDPLPSRLLIKESILIREHSADKSLNGNIGTGELLLW